MYNATIICVHAYAYLREHVGVRARVTIVVHTDMYAVAGILRNMQEFNYLLGYLKYRLDVQCSYAVCVHAYTYVRERACANVNVRAWVNVHAYVRVRKHSNTLLYML